VGPDLEIQKFVYNDMHQSICVPIKFKNRFSTKLGQIEVIKESWDFFRELLFSELLLKAQ
jgi:hypothetical protein